MPDPLHPQHERRAGAHPTHLTRRRFLNRSAMAVAGGVLFSCTGGKRIVKATNDPTATLETATPIKRAIYVMLENRSFNNLFGTFPGVRGTATGVLAGQEIPLRPCPEYLPGDLQHDRAAFLNDLHGGRQDAFGGGTFGDPWAYSVHDGHQLPNYWMWAKEFAISDHFFSSAAGPSYPNHFFFIAGQSGGAIDNPENIETTQLPDGGGLFKSWGCDAVGKDVFVFVKDPQGNLTKHDTCFRFSTVGEQLTGIGVDWAFYAASPGQPGYFWTAYNGIHDVFHDKGYWNAHVKPVDRLMKDIEAGALPAVTWITPRFQESDHPPYSSAWAHNWVTDIVNGVMKSDMWEHTVIFVTWDEWGGFYDPVAPPAVDEVGLGFRVPLLTIGPYVIRGVIDDEVGEFSTPLRFISDNWGLDPLTPRIAKAHNFDHVFDFTKPPRKPVIAPGYAKTYLKSPWQNPGPGYPGWPPGTTPQDFIP